MVQLSVIRLLITTAVLQYPAGVRGAAVEVTEVWTNTVANYDEIEKTTTAMATPTSTIAPSATTGSTELEPLNASPNPADRTSHQFYHDFVGFERTAKAYVDNMRHNLISSLTSYYDIFQNELIHLKHSPSKNHTNSLDTCFSLSTSTACSQYKIDDKNITGSFKAMSAVLAEQIRQHFWGIETELIYLKETAVSADTFKTLLLEMCKMYQDEEPACYNGTSDGLRSEINVYREVRNNITKELIGTQKRVREVYKSLKHLKQQHLSHINKSLVECACCLKASKFTTEDYGFKCPEPETEPKPRPLPEWRNPNWTWTLPPSCGSFSWVEKESGLIPLTAVEAGTDKGGQKIYVGRVWECNDLIPAKVVPHYYGAFIPYNGSEIKKGVYQVLASDHVGWKRKQGSGIPPEAIRDGQTNTGEPLYMGRATHDGTVTPGKIYASQDKLFIPWGGSEVEKDEYEIMVHTCATN